MYKRSADAPAPEYAGLDAELWNRMFHAAHNDRKRYRTISRLEAVVIAVLAAIILCKLR